MDTATAPTPDRRGPNTRRRSIITRWWAVLALAAGITLLVTATIAALSSKSYWGYFFVRPSPHHRILSAQQVLSVTSFGFVEQPGQLPAVVLSNDPYTGPGWYAAEKAANPFEYDYYLLDRRVLHALELRNVLTAPVPTLPQERLPDLPSMLQPLVEPETMEYAQTLPSNARGPWCSGMLYELIGARGERLLVLTFTGVEVSNDHFPYLEVLYEAHPDRDPVLISRTRFYYDVAGIEHVEFPAVFLFLAVCGLALVLPPIGAALLYRRFSGWGAVSRGHCPRCRYDLRGDFPAGCPECGWGRGENAAAETDLRRYTPLATLARLIARPPSWTTFTLTLAGLTMLAIGSSTPGRHTDWINWGTVASVLAAHLFLIKLVAWTVPAVRRTGRTARFRWLRVAAIVGLAALTIWATAGEGALRLRFHLSRKALDQLVAGSPYPFAGAPTRAGLYTVDGVHNDGPAVFVSVPGDNDFYISSFVCSPAGKPDIRTSSGKPLHCTPIADGWYLWRYHHD